MTYIYRGSYHGGNMKRIAASLILMFMAVCLYARNVNIILNDGTVIKGGLLGKTSDSVYVESTNGQSLTVKIDDIKSAFDQDSGEVIDFTAADSQSAQPGSNDNGPAAVVTNTVTNKGTVEEAQEPQLVVIPGTYVYYYNYGDYDCFYYGGFWWRPWQGYWYRSGGFEGGWVVVNPRVVPYYVVHMPVNWRERVAYGPRVGWGQVRIHSGEWERGHYWGNRGWRGGTVVRQNNVINRGSAREPVRQNNVQRKRNEDR